MTDTNRAYYINQLKSLFRKKFTIFDINYSYEMNVVSLKPEDDNYNYNKLKIYYNIILFIVLV